MYNEPPQWPDRPAQTPEGRPPQSRNTVLLALVAIVAGVLIVALVGTLVLLVARGAQGGNSVGQEQSAAAATAAAGGAAANGQPTPVSGDATTSAGGNSATPTPTNTPSSASAEATPTSTGITVICCLTIAPSIHQVVSQTTLSGTDIGPVSVSCPAGEIALSGGWASSNSSDIFIYNSTRNGTGGWKVYVNHASSLLVNSYAECLKNASGATIAERLTQVSVAPGSTNSAIASCNSGEVLVGGGFALNTGLELYNFSANSATQWAGYAKNHGTTSGLLNTYAECLRYSGAHSSQTSYRQSSIAAGATGGTTSNACPSGTAVSGGGYADGIDAFIYTMSADSGGTTWTAYLYANGGKSELLNSYAMCLGF
jgi:hypothetical protein